ncbi:hypothetical protein OTU49_008068 [Cherax quadricarinatus]|uniref:Uncharacterized protein n=1 Tax=Cherax quadricarinatus TaxID=27406 RepID=A0AAW0WXU1_CHEQU|nr:uncharacterized protein LOC128700049 [Cherax quadricarinatus]
MFLSAFLPLLLAAVVSPPFTMALLLPPEGNDYPLYDFPSVQYLPHNSLIEYQDPRLVDDERMEVATRSTYLPLPPSDSSSSSLYPQSASSSSPPLPCTAEDIASILNMEDLDKVIKIVSKLEGKSVKEILHKLAVKHGLHFKDKELHHEKKPQFDNAVPAVSPRGLPVSRLPRALLLVADASRNEVARTQVDLAPRMALLDVLTEAKSVYALNNGPYRHNPFTIKARRVETEACLGLQSVGHIRATPTRPILLSVTRTRPTEQVVWESICLPRASDLLVRPGDVIILAPR